MTRISDDYTLMPRVITSFTGPPLGTYSVCQPVQPPHRLTATPERDYRLG